MGVDALADIGPLGVFPADNDVFDRNYFDIAEKGLVAIIAKSEGKETEATIGRFCYQNSLGLLEAKWGLAISPNRH